MDENQTISAIKKMIIGCIIAQYGAIQLLDSSKQDLKFKVKNVISAVKSVENWFLYNQNTSDKFREQFKKEFKANEVLMLAELFEAVFGIDEDSLEHLIENIRQNTDSQ